MRRSRNSNGAYICWKEEKKKKKKKEEEEEKEDEEKKKKNCGHFCSAVSHRQECIDRALQDHVYVQHTNFIYIPKK